ncbi:unnamed protein product [Protopolystoma xenopodis]|uniref:Uncharacterized protein n=1 Tax=Protopolystoma xenopodis TaxID=117903 RepID=A0A448XBR1_9PLAT|nr:unnamed protein product [Protopolystoma xenopodis]
MHSRYQAMERLTENELLLKDSLVGGHRYSGSASAADPLERHSFILPSHQEDISSLSGAGGGSNISSGGQFFRRFFSLRQAQRRSHSLLSEPLSADKHICNHGATPGKADRWVGLGLNRGHFSQLPNSLHQHNSQLNSPNHRAYYLTVSANSRPHSQCRPRSPSKYSISGEAICSGSKRPSGHSNLDSSADAGLGTPSAHGGNFNVGGIEAGCDGHGAIVGPNIASSLGKGHRYITRRHAAQTVGSGSGRRNLAIGETIQESVEERDHVSQKTSAPKNAISEVASSLHNTRQSQDPQQFRQPQQQQLQLPISVSSTLSPSLPICTIATLSSLASGDDDTDRGRKPFNAPSLPLGSSSVTSPVHSPDTLKIRLTATAKPKSALNVTTVGKFQVAPVESPPDRLSPIERGAWIRPSASSSQLTPSTSSGKDGLCARNAFGYHNPPPETRTTPASRPTPTRSSELVAEVEQIFPGGAQDTTVFKTE